MPQILSCGIASPSLASIPGVGKVAAFAMLAEMPALGTLEYKGAARRAGLAPTARDSGQHRGKRCIRGGRAPLRQALHLPALVALRFDAAIKAKYRALLAAGKPPKVALIAIMRKLLMLANALIRAGRIWTQYGYSRDQAATSCSRDAASRRRIWRLRPCGR